jgi:hypothetical protein
MLKRLLVFFISIFFISNLSAQDQSLAYSSDNNSTSGIEITFKPNPLKNTAQVDIKGLQANNYKFFVYDITGRVVRQYSQQHQQSFIFEREDLDKGFYFYKLIAPGKKVVAGRFQVVD